MWKFNWISGQSDLFREQWNGIIMWVPINDLREEWRSFAGNVHVTKSCAKCKRQQYCLCVNSMEWKTTVDWRRWKRLKEMCFHRSCKKKSGRLREKERKEHIEGWGDTRGKRKRQRERGIKRDEGEERERNLVRERTL